MNKSYLAGVCEMSTLKGLKVRLGRMHKGTYGFRDENDILFELQGGCLGVLTGRIGFDGVFEGSSYSDAVRQDSKLELLAEVQWENEKKCFVSTMSIPGLYLTETTRGSKRTVLVSQN